MSQIDPRQAGQYGSWQPPQYPQQWAPPPPPPRRRRGPIVLLVTFALAVLVGVGVAGWAIGRETPGTPETSFSFPQQQQPRQQQPQQQEPQQQPLDSSEAASKVAAGLVDINTVLGYQGGQAAGTGIVLTANGEILTNNHVVEGATQISVTDIENGQSYEASVVGYDRSHDIAVIQLKNASGLTTAPLGDSSSVQVGDQILGIGNAGGRGGAPDVAPGTVTALDQSITATDETGSSSEVLTGLIQVNANIQAGDSGGALANSSGQVVGVDTAASAGYRLGRRGGQVGGAEGYAIPINQALTIAKQIESKTASSTVHIGESAIMGVSITDTTGGVGIQQVVSGGPAAQAGLAAGSVITALDGQPTTSTTALTHAMDQHHPGDSVKVTWLDQTGQQHTSTVKLATGPVG